MRLLKEGMPGPDERLAYREVVFANAIQSMMVVVEAVESLGLVLEPSMRRHADLLESLDPDDPMTTDFQGNLLPELASAVAALWQDDAVQKAVSRSHLYQLNDSAPYYFDSIDRVGARGYIPSVEDLLRSRVKSTGIVEATFPMAGGVTGRIFDVGGQRSERKKWVHCFEGVNLVFFVVAVSEFNQILYEDSTTNRMAEAMTLFESVANSRWFSSSSILLFLNKIDLLEEKLKTDRVGEYFPDYDGPNESREVLAYWRHRFGGLYRHQWRTLVVHATCATDVEQTRVVFKAVEQHILESQLANTGLL